jgi:DNA-binding response OmpR family regulator
MISPGHVPVLAITRAGYDRVALGAILGHSRWRPLWASAVGDGVGILTGVQPGVVLCTAEIAGPAWKEMVNEAARLRVPPAVVVLADSADDSLWAEVFNLGGYDVLIRPFDPREVIHVLSQAWRAWDEARQRLEARLSMREGAA